MPTKLCFETDDLSKNMKNLLKQIVAPNGTISLGYFILSKASKRNPNSEKSPNLVNLIALRTVMQQQHRLVECLFLLESCRVGLSLTLCYIPCLDHQYKTFARIIVFHCRQG
jgi:hypothetical protein